MKLVRFNWLLALRYFMISFSPVFTVWKDLVQISSRSSEQVGRGRCFIILFSSRRFFKPPHALTRTSLSGIRAILMRVTNFGKIGPAFYEWNGLGKGPYQCRPVGSEKFYEIGFFIDEGKKSTLLYNCVPIEIVNRGQIHGKSMQNEYF